MYQHAIFTLVAFRVSSASQDSCFWILAQDFGETVACPANYVATGACGSGNYAECDNAFVHKLRCCALNSGYSTNCGLKKAEFGQTVTCDYGQAVTGSCGSGGWADCAGYSAEAVCCDAPNISLDYGEQYLLQGDCGQTLSCDSGYVMTSLCGSGSQHDCKEHGGEYCWEATCTGYTERKPRTVIFEENWTNFDNWQHEVTFEIFNNEFQYYRNDRRNSFLDNGVLTINPTFTADEFGEDFLYSGTIDLSTECTRGQCSKTGTYDDILHPVQSARLISRHKFSFKYGRIEVKMQMPKGDWLWPAFWLMPEDEVYGGWPTSGEIDILETRGNAGLDCWGSEFGRKCLQSTIHYGPTPGGAGKSQDSFSWCGADLSDGFHDYAFEWTPTGMQTYIDGEKVLNVDSPFHGFFEKGHWSGYNPWEAGTDLAPFDQEFYMIINLAVGGDYFPDGCWNSGPIQKPWYMGQASQKRSFWWDGQDYRNENHRAVENWEDPGFLVDRIKIFSYE